MGERLKTKRNRTPEQIDLLKQVRLYQAKMKMRIGIGNQVGAMLRQELITPEEAATLEGGLTKPLVKVEGQIIRAAAKELKGMPIWEDWLSKVRGVGGCLGVQFVALIQPISDFDTVAALWSYSGYGVVDGEAPRRQAGVQSRWNPDLRKLGYQLGDCFVRAGGPYRELYDCYKARDRAVHPDPVTKTDKSGKLMKTREGKAWKMYTDGHIHARARRYAVKIFLSHLWQAWRELEGLLVRGPYAVEYLGHTKILSPWAFIDKEPKNDVDDEAVACVAVA